MTDLTKQLEQALKFDHWAGMKTDYVDGRIFENARLAPLHAALLKCVEALEFYDEEQCLASRAIADLRKALEECK